MSTYKFRLEYAADRLQGPSQRMDPFIQHSTSGLMPSSSATAGPLLNSKADLAIIQYANPEQMNKQPYGSGDLDEGFTIEFPNLDAFFAWKSAEESQNCVEFTRCDIHTSKANPPRFKEHVKLVCGRHARAGRKKYVKKYPDRQRKNPSRKLEGAGCPATIAYKTYMDSSIVRVSYQSNHSHETGEANLPFTKRGRSTDHHVSSSNRRRRDHHRASDDMQASENDSSISFDNIVFPEEMQNDDNHDHYYGPQQDPGPPASTRSPSSTDEPTEVEPSSNINRPNQELYRNPSSHLHHLSQPHPNTSHPHPQTMQQHQQQQQQIHQHPTQNQHHPHPHSAPMQFVPYMGHERPRELPEQPVHPVSRAQQPPGPIPPALAQLYADSQPQLNPQDMQKMSRERWKRITDMFMHIRTQAQTFDYPNASVSALEMILFRMHIESPYEANPGH